MGTTTAGHRVEQAARTVSAWRVIVGGLVVALAWFAGQAGWLSVSPGDRVKRLEDRSAAQELRIDLNERQLAEIRSTQQFTVELLCVPVLDGPAVSNGDRLLKNRCGAFLDVSQ